MLFDHVLSLFGMTHIIKWNPSNPRTHDDITIIKDTPKLARNLWTQEDTADFKAELPLRVQPHETLLFKIVSA